MARLLVVCLVLAAAAAEVNPVTKVMQLLGDLQAKIIKEGTAAQQVYEEYAEWCEDRSKEIGFDLKTAKAAAEEIEAKIAAEESKIEMLSGRIEEVAAAISVDQKDAKAAKEIRDKEHADFSAVESDLVQTIDILERAIAIIEREQAKGASLLQLRGAQSVTQALSAIVGAEGLSSADVAQLTALVQDGEEDGDDDTGAPDPEAYESHSGGIVETLEGLREKAATQLDDERKTETANLHSYQLLAEGIANEIKDGEKELGEAKTASAAAAEAKSVEEGDLAVTKKGVADSTEALEKLHHDCMSHATDFEEETKSRGEELKALATAKKVIQESTGGDGAAAYVTLVQVSSRRTSTRARDSMSRDLRVLKLVRGLARQHHSPALSQLAARMASVLSSDSADSEDPFAKVKGLIQQMLERLLSEGQAEANKKAFCDKEMAETAEKKEDKNDELAKLNTKIEKMSATSAKLKSESAELQRELAALIKGQAEMDKLRLQEKAIYDESKPELEMGLNGVKLALKVLREYYSKDDKAHDSADGAASGIIGLLEVVESDFAKSLAEVVATEQAAIEEYQEETKQNEILKVQMEKDLKYKTKEAAQLDQATVEATSDRDAVQTELDAVLEYEKKINGECVAKAESYEERKKRREAELAGLREALTILEGEAVLLQQGSSRRLRPGARRA